MGGDERERRVVSTIQSQQRGYAGRQYRPDGRLALMNDTWRSTDGGVTWTEMNASAGWSARERHSSVAMPDGSIVLMGGWDDSGGSKNDVWRSTDNGVTWVEMNASAGWSARERHTSVAMPDGSIVLMGGYTGSASKNDTWRSTDNGATWTLVNASSGWTARYRHSSVAMPDGSIVLDGGLGQRYYRNDTWRSTDNGVTWAEMNASAGWTARIDHTSVVLPDSSIVLMGGYDSSGFMNDTWRFQPAGSSLQNPSHTYTTPGTYQVALQAYNAGGYNSTRKVSYINVTSGGFNVLGCTDINSPGTYTLQNEILNSSSLTCINILSSDVTFDGNRHIIDGKDTGGTTGIGASGLNNITISNVTLTDWGMGIYYWNMDGGLLQNITYTSNENGMQIAGWNLTLTNNTATYNIYDGMWVSGWNNTIRNNTLAFNGNNGLYLQHDNNTVINNIARNNTLDGINASYSSNNTFSGNTLNYNTKMGFNVYSGMNNTITDNTANNNQVHGFLNSGYYNNFTHNTANNNGNDGIAIVYSTPGNGPNHIIQDNNFDGNLVGISVYYTRYNTIKGNFVTNSTGDGIIFTGNTATDNLIYNNYFNNNYITVEDSQGDSANFYNVTKTPGTNIFGGSWLGGNYWSDYTGVDNDGDGLGNTHIPFNYSGSIAKGGDYLPLTTASTPYIDVSVNGTINNWNFVTGTNEDLTSVNLTVDTNINQWNVDAKDALDTSKPAGTEGKMAEWSGSAYVPSGKVLLNAVQVKYGTGSDVTLSGANQLITSGISPGTYKDDLGISQMIAPTDPALSGSNKYRIVVTFTGSAA